jgi:hypothetical protein
MAEGGTQKKKEKKKSKTESSITSKCFAKGRHLCFRILLFCFFEMPFCAVDFHPREASGRADGLGQARGEE